MSINFPDNPSTNDTYTYLTTTWKWNGYAWEKSAATETGNTEGNTGEVAFYSGKGSIIAGATAFFYDGDKVGIGTSGPTEMLDVRGGITASGSIYSGDNIKVKGGITAGGGIYAAGGATFGGMGVDVTGGLTADVLQVSGETVFNGTVTAISTGDVALNLVADSDNSGENDNPIISMGQDGALARFDLGIVGDAGQIFTNSLANAAFLDTANSSNDLQFSVAGAAKMTILDSGNIGIGTNAPTQKLSVIGGGITADNGIYVAGGVTFSNLSVNDNYNFPTSAPSEGNILLVGSDGDLKFEPHTDSTSFVVDSDIPLATGIRYKAIYKVPYSNMVVTRLDLRSDDESPASAVSGDSLQVALKGIRRETNLEAASPTIQATIETIAIPLGGQHHHGTNSITNANIGEDNSVTYLVVDVTGNAGGHSNFCLMVWLGVRS